MEEALDLSFDILLMMMMMMMMMMMCEPPVSQSLGVSESHPGSHVCHCGCGLCEVGAEAEDTIRHLTCSAP